MTLTIISERNDTAQQAPRWRGILRPAYFLILLVVAVVAIFTAVGSSYQIYIVDTVLLAAIGAIALDLLMGTGGQVSIGNAAFLAAGAYSTVWAGRAGVPFPFDVIIGALVCAVAGLRGMYLALATLAAFYIAQFVGQTYQTDTVGAAGFIMTPVFSGTISQQSAKWAWLLVAVVGATIILASWLRAGRSGRAWRMIRDHEIAASMMGVPVARYKLLLFVISSALIGLEGGLTARFIGAITYDSYTISLSISFVAMILIGGLDTMAGPLIGALVVTTLPIFVPDIINLVGSSSSSSLNAGNYAEIVYGALIIIFMIKAPKGLTGAITGLGKKAQDAVADRRRRNESSQP
jgi:branched-chain amino acid transport system permease protein